MSFTMPHPYLDIHPDVAQAMAQRRLTGAPGPEEVRKQLAKWEKLLKKME